MNSSHDYSVNKLNWIQIILLFGVNHIPNMKLRPRLIIIL